MGAFYFKAAGASMLTTSEIATTLDVAASAIELTISRRCLVRLMVNGLGTLSASQLIALRALLQPRQITQAQYEQENSEQ